MATHCSVLAWRIPWTEKPGGLQSMGSHRVGHDWGDLAAAAAAVLFHFMFLFVNTLIPFFYINLCGWILMSLIFFPFFFKVFLGKNQFFSHSLVCLALWQEILFILWITPWILCLIFSVHYYIIKDIFLDDLKIHRK